MSAQEERKVPLDHERSERNLQAIRITGIPMMVLHAVVMGAYFPHGSLSDPAQHFRLIVVLAHTAGFFAMLGCWLGMREKHRLPQDAGRHLGTIVSVVYIFVGVTLSINAQRSTGNSNSFILASIGVGAVMLMHPRVSALVYLLSAITASVGVTLLQRNADFRLATVIQMVSTSIIGVSISWAKYRAMQREFELRGSLAESKAALQALNQELEGRVKAQVAETLAQAKELAELDAHLRALVLNRANQLTNALLEVQAEQRESAVGSHAPNAHDTAAGSVIDCRVKLLRVVGKGGMGTVYEGLNIHTQNRVAVKLHAVHGQNTASFLRRFAAEAEAATRIVHPGVVRTLGVGQNSDGTFWQIMDYVDGVTLSELLYSGPMAKTEGLMLCLRVAEALSSAHKAGVVHRDIKPSNVMIARDGPVVRILDFGISKLTGLQDASSTTTGAVIGTPASMAPEQVTDTRNVSTPADVYAWALLLFDCLTVTSPFGTHPTPQAWMLAQVSQVPARLADLLPSIDPAIDALVAECLRKAPEDRPTIDRCVEVLLACQLPAEAETALRARVTQRNAETIRAKADPAKLRSVEMQATAVQEQEA